MIISVASGKGGTGKTTVATNLALALREQVELLDCDVEEPNADLFLKPLISRTEKVETPIPLIDGEKCSGCGKCAEICRFNAITVIGGKVLVFPELCHSCGGCMLVCPEGAISETGRELGTISFGRRNGIGFINGRLRVGEAMSPPLIRKVKAEADPNLVTIIDAPPGTSCPVIAAMNGTDFILMVTEPTPFGLHDLRLAVEAVRVLNIPCGLVINRADIGDLKVFAYAESEEVPILMTIPFDRQIAEIYSRGQALIEEIPEWRQQFLNLYGRIEAFTESWRRKKQCAN
ncbi:MAG: ATP-binding protein [Desulfobulbaceae bacterium]|nr:ATP-binding protein [Desulfobulbaceae bacterium]MDY0349622.1 ATP-binding protein [Desulfobulbaceae bacterium]